MLTDMTKTAINGLHRYEAETVELEIGPGGTLWDTGPYMGLAFGACVIGFFQEERYQLPNSVSDNITFSHVLHSLTAEAVWPGDAAELFFRDMFAVRLVNEVEVYQEDNMLLAHIREELMRLCGDYYTTEELWLRNFDYSSELYNYSFEDEKQFDDDDEDTLHSELLLTEEYIAPDSVSVQTQTLRPQRRVGAIQHIEQED